jgi:proteasome lid subunit RPN8/RPN11
VPGIDADYAALAPRLAALAEADPDREVCGFVVSDAEGRLEVVPVRNVAGEGEGPPGVAPDPRRAFLADPSAQLALARRLRLEGGRIAAAYHSHPDAPAELSPSDVEQALCDGAPLHPGIDWIVVGIARKKVTEIRVFRWIGGRFRSTRIPCRG